MPGVLNPDSSTLEFVCDSITKINDSCLNSVSPYQQNSNGINTVDPSVSNGLNLSIHNFTIKAAHLFTLARVVRKLERRPFAATNGTQQ